MQGFVIARFICTYLDPLHALLVTKAALIASNVLLDVAMDRKTAIHMCICVSEVVLGVANVHVDAVVL